MSTDRYRVTLLPGDGIGPEVIEAAGVAIAWKRVEAGAEVFAKYGTPLPDAALNAIRETGVALKGPIGTPIGGGSGSANVALRQSLDLYACVRPVKTIPAVPTHSPGSIS